MKPQSLTGQSDREVEREAARRFRYQRGLSRRIANGIMDPEEAAQNRANNRQLKKLQGE
jgi:hypothetical protein